MPVVPYLQRVSGQWLAFLIWLGFMVAIAAILFSAHLSSVPSLRQGQVSPVTVRSPISLTFVDENATSRARLAVARHTPPVLVIDRTANTQALSLADAAVAQLTVILRDNSDVDARTLALAAALPTNRPRSLVPALAALDATSWRMVTDGLSSQLHYATTHSLTSDAVNAAISVATLPPPAEFDPSAREAFRDLLLLYFHPNTHVDPAATARAQRDAQSRVSPVTVMVQQGQVIVRSGDIVDAPAIARLNAVRAALPPLSLASVLGMLLLSFLLVGALAAYMLVFTPAYVRSAHHTLLLALIVTATMIAARIAIGGHQAYAYAFPIGVATLLVSVLLDSGLGIVVALVTAFVAGEIVTGSYEMTLYYAVGAAIGSLLVHRVRRLNQFFIAGIWITAAECLIIASLHLLGQNDDAISISTALVGALLNGGLCATLALGSFGLLGHLFGITTALQLLELSHPDQPLLRRLMLQAPGTYHHSLMIGNLAERAADQIGADPLVARVCAYYHDIGKLCSPANFAENQARIGNIHDTLPPAESARLIRQHVIDGLRLARQYHLPKVIQDGIAEHHGMNLVGFFYRRAREEHPDLPLNILEFSYPGPKPQSRETAILMLADGVEAAARATDTSDLEQLQAVIHKVVQERLRDGQLDECQLTLRDLTIIEDSFLTVLSGISHRRIVYPDPIVETGHPIEHA